MSIFETAAAHAQAAPGAAPPQGIAAFLASPFAMLILIFVIFYFLIIRPQQKRQREVQEMLRNLKRGDKVVTACGMYGTILDLDDTRVTLQVDDRVKIRMARSSVSGLVSE